MQGPRVRGKLMWTGQHMVSYAALNRTRELKTYKLLLNLLTEVTSDNQNIKNQNHRWRKSYYITSLKKFKRLIILYQIIKLHHLFLGSFFHDASKGGILPDCHTPTLILNIYS